ncbi:YccS family putative transporter [Aliivibrio kagoshimensis]|uniref:YccS family putative transporter n=1 Tax=Aliivibrio kagoshimensis TaxID=2910230 RepID=UPI003D0B5391
MNSTIKKYWANNHINYSVRILLALLGVVIPCWYFDQNSTATLLILGIIAAALAETDGSFSGRIKAQSLTLISFAIASFSIELLFNYPVFFAAGLFFSSIAFIMLGAIGPRYAGIAFGSLMMAIYTMLGASESTNIWYQPSMLLSGAAWYYFISLCWQLFWPMQPVQQSLAEVFDALGKNLIIKSELFHPVSNLNPQPYRIKASQQNVKVVTALNNCKATLLARAKRGHVVGAKDRFLKIYFLAQDIHERVSSTHYRYQDLASNFKRSDILFRLEHLLKQQSKACDQAANALRLGNAYSHPSSSTAIDEMTDSLQFLKQQNNAEWRLSLIQLEYLLNNLSTVERQLSNIGNPLEISDSDESVLADDNAHTLKEMGQRVIANFNTRSMLFRHAIRMAVALTIGYGIIQLTQLDNGYWILLTTLFVCQPNYSSTKVKLIARVVGTIAGILLGIPLLMLFPSHDSQLVLMVIAGVLFFAFRRQNYRFSTAFITLLVLFGFNQLGDGYAVILPRLGDTLLGCLLAVLAVTFIFPDWQSRRLHKVMSDAVKANQDYLAQIIGQYRAGKKDSLAYRIARRKAHNADAQLSSAINNMLVEPGRYRTYVDESFRFLCLNHAMLSYISALGAHRTRLSDEVTHQLVAESHRVIHRHLSSMSEQLNQLTKESNPTEKEDQDLDKRLGQWREDDADSVKMVLQQIHLIHRMMPEMHSLANKVASRAQAKMPSKK